MWRNHSREFYVLVLGTVVLWAVLIVGLFVLLSGFQSIYESTQNITKNGTHITFTLKNKYGAVSSEYGCANYTKINNFFYDLYNVTEFETLTLNQTYTCEITKNKPQFFFGRNESISNCTMVGV